MKSEKVKCNLCGSSEEKILFSTGHGNVVKCLKCGLVYRNPRLSEEDTISLYGQSIEPHYEEVNISKEKLFRSALKFLSFQFRITQLPDYQSPKLLDIGCSDGFFLLLAKEYGFDVYGVEISKLAVRRARERLRTRIRTNETARINTKIFEGTLGQANFPDNFFDIVTLWDVLDHFYDPLSELKETKRILKRDGLLVVRVRNENFHVSVYAISRNFAERFALSPTVFHLYNFSPITIKKILAKAEFKKIEVYNSKMTLGDAYSGGRILGVSGMNLIKKFIFSFCQVLYYFSKRSLVLAPSMLVYARK